LSVSGHVDNFTIHLQPSGFNRLFGIPMTELIPVRRVRRHRSGIPMLEHELGDIAFPQRIRATAFIASRFRDDEHTAGSSAADESAVRAP
jgi:hypothetical protein